ncbi:MAG: hypothetical protein H6821_00730 [Planctomycetaceae bacterium]|nr:hypothetical protein [Planctomycetaceae bacterium]MCB9926161.1 hypothetical protein [Planctomycetaceae bacterium]
MLPKRLGRFSLEVAEEKTKLLRFGRFAERDSTRRVEGTPGKFDFLGFTHYCGHARSGRFKLKRRTATKKLRAKLADMQAWFHSMLTTPIEEVWSTLNAKLRGHYQYYGINDNWPRLMEYHERVRCMARRHLSRRSQKTRVTWADFNQYLARHVLATPKQLTDLIAMSRVAGKV